LTCQTDQERWTKVTREKGNPGGDSPTCGWAQQSDLGWGDRGFETKTLNVTVKRSSASVLILKKTVKRSMVKELEKKRRKKTAPKKKKPRTTGRK